MNGEGHNLNDNTDICDVTGNWTQIELPAPQHLVKHSPNHARHLATKKAVCLKHYSAKQATVLAARQEHQLEYA